MYLMRPDRVTRTSVIEPFNLNLDPGQVAQAQLDRWSAIAQAGGVPDGSLSGARGFGRPMRFADPFSPIIGTGPQPNLTPAGAQAQLPANRTLPVGARPSNAPPLGRALDVAIRLSRLSADKQQALLHQLSYAYAHQGAGIAAGALRAILTYLPVTGGTINLVASYLAHLHPGQQQVIAVAIRKAAQA